MNKLIFSGPPGAGKTAAIQAISDIPVVATEQSATEALTATKAGTTVAMDYGYIDLGDQGKVHLYGTPGQQRFDFMWQILAKGGAGLVLLVSNRAPTPLDDLVEYVNAFRGFIDDTDVVVGVTGLDEQRRPGLSLYQERLRETGVNAPVVEADARCAADVKQLVTILLTLLDPEIRR